MTVLVRHSDRVTLRSRSSVRGVTPAVFVEAMSAFSQTRTGERAAVLRPGERGTFAVDAATPGTARCAGSPRGPPTSCC